MERTGGHLAACLAAAAALGFVACARAPAPEPPQNGGTLRVAVLEALDPPFPLYGMSPTTADLVAPAIPPLGRIDDHGRLRLQLASRFFDNGAHIDFGLRPVRWEDGVPVSPRDIVVATRLRRDTRLQSPERPRTDLMRDCVALDDSTVRFEFATIYARRRRDALLSPLPSHRPPWPPGADSLRDRPYSDVPLSCGPYRIAHTESRSMLLVRNDASGFPPARLDSVRVEVTDPDSAVAAFRAGRLDVIWDLSPDRIPEVRRRRGTRAMALVGRSYVFVGWNLRDGRFADPAVRRAAAMAVDLSGIAHELTFGLADPSRGPLTALSGFPDTTALLPHDPRRAERALEDAGWHDADGDGARDRRGARLDFNLLVTRGETLRVEAARRVARDLSRVGIVARVRELAAEEMAQRLRSRNFEAFVGQWYPDAEGGLDPVWRSESADQLNFIGYASARTDSLLTRLTHELEPEDRAAVLSRFQARVYADQPYLFLFQNPHFLVLAARVRGADPEVGSPFWNLTQWWIPARLR